MTRYALVGLMALGLLIGCSEDKGAGNGGGTGSGVTLLSAPAGIKRARANAQLTKFNSNNLFEVEMKLEADMKYVELITNSDDNLKQGINIRFVRRANDTISVQWGNGAMTEGPEVVTVPDAGDELEFEVAVYNTGTEPVVLVHLHKADGTEVEVVHDHLHAFGKGKRFGIEYATLAEDPVVKLTKDIGAHVHP